MADNYFNIAATSTSAQYNLPLPPEQSGGGGIQPGVKYQVKEYLVSDDDHIICNTNLKDVFEKANITTFPGNNQLIWVTLFDLMDYSLDNLFHYFHFELKYTDTTISLYNLTPFVIYKGENDSIVSGSSNFLTTGANIYYAAREYGLQKEGDRIVINNDALLINTSSDMSTINSSSIIISPIDKSTQPYIELHQRTNLLLATIYNATGGDLNLTNFYNFLEKIGCVFVLAKKINEFSEVENPPETNSLSQRTIEKSNNIIYL